MAKVQYLDQSGLVELIAQIKAADAVVKAFAGDLTGKTDADGQAYTSVQAYLEDQITASTFSGDAEDVAIADEDELFTAENVEDALAELAANIDLLEEADESKDGTIAKMIRDQIGELKVGDTTYATAKAYVDALNAAVLKLIHGETGDITDLHTTVKTDLVSAINEIEDEIGAKAVAGETPVAATGIYKYVDDAVAAVDSTTANKMSIEEVSTGLEDSVLKAYNFYQGVVEGDSEAEKAAKKIGTINIAKDLVVESGEVVAVAENEVDGLAAGTYLKLTIANQTAPVYILTSDLCDIYTSGSEATDMVVVAVDEATNQITATITDATVTKAKLAEELANEITAATTAIGVESKAPSSEGATDGVEATGIYKRLEDLEAIAGDGVEGIPVATVTSLFASTAAATV